MKIYRVVVRGHFDGLTDEVRSKLLAEQATVTDMASIWD